MDSDALTKELQKHILLQRQRGERIETEARLAQRFGVTRYRIRKALTVLEQMGLLDRRPKRGTTVRELAPGDLSSSLSVQMDIANFDIREFIEARLLIETAIIPLTVRRMTPAMAGRLESAITRIAANAHQPLVADRYDREFHLLLLEACGNRILQVFSGTLVTYFEKTAPAVAERDEHYFEQVAETERAIFNAIMAGDAELATTLLRRNLCEEATILTQPTFSAQAPSA